MQKNNKQKNETINKLRMILDDPNIQDETIKNKNLLKLQKKLIKPSYARIIKSKKELEKKDTNDPLKATAIIHRKDKIQIYKENIETIGSDKLEYVGANEDLFKDEELYEIEKIEEEIPEFTEIENKDKIIEETSEEFKIDEDQKIESTDDLPEWKTVEDESKEIVVKEEKKESSKDIPEWEPITTEQFKEKSPKIKQKKIKKEKDIIGPEISLEENNVFKNIKSIDSKIAGLLIENGYNSIDDLKELTIKDFTKISGIKRRIAKRIKKDIKDHFEKQQYPEFESIEEEISDEDFEKEGRSHYEEDENGICKYGEYTLYKKEIKLQSGKTRIIHFFSREEPDDGVEVSLPDGYEIKVNKKTGVPYISSIK